MTEAAQLGMKPMSPESSGWKTLPWSSSREMFSSPTSSMAQPRAIFTASRNRNIFTVCPRAERSTPFSSQPQSSQSSWKGSRSFCFRNRLYTRSTAMPVKAPAQSFTPSRGPRLPAAPGRDSRMGRASSEVERNTAISVPGVMSRPA